MRRLVVGGLLLAVISAIAAPAAAHPQGVKDPFQPLVTEQQATATGTDANEQQTTQRTTETRAFQENGADALANTGAPVMPWLAAAYALLVCGAAAVAIAKINRAPIRVRSR